MSLREKINALGETRTPFVFCISYDKKDGFAYAKDELPRHIKIDMSGPKAANGPTPSIIKCTPIDFDSYKNKIETIKEHVKNGDIYLANLTCTSDIKLSGTLLDIFESSAASFKLLVDDYFAINSPEEFITIKDGIISTYPMKGTAEFEGEASIEALLASDKELAEHTMVVDLLRNDLSMVANEVRVPDFRYPIIINANGKKLIQSVSKITGKLEEGYEKNFGDILFTMLPAGSITGTPKKKCVEILQKTEMYERGFYCGIFGEYDGYTLKSAVSIRYIEKTKSGYVYKSGGGITIDSDPMSEYEEMIKKVYLAF